MRVLRMNFDGDDGVSLDWAAESDGLLALVHKVNSNLLTSFGSDTLLRNRGNRAMQEITGYGAFDLMNIQHSLNFAASKTAADIALYAGDQVNDLDSLLIKLYDVADNRVRTVLFVTHTNGEKTKEPASLS